MPSVVSSSFADLPGALAAAERLVQHGFAPDRVHLHERGTRPRNATGIEIDEYATGGMVSNLLGLLDGIFNAKPQPDEAANYKEVVEQEGVGLSVLVADEGEAERARASLEANGGMDVTRHETDA
jgi:hypothetical protein